MAGEKTVGIGSLPERAREKALDARWVYERDLRRVRSWPLAFALAAVAGGIHVATGFPAIIPAVAAYGVYAYYAGRRLEKKLRQSALDIVHDNHSFFRNALDVGRVTSVFDRYHVSLEPGGQFKFVPKPRRPRI